MIIGGIHTIGAIIAIKGTSGKEMREVETGIVEIEIQIEIVVEIKMIEANGTGKINTANEIIMVITEWTTAIEWIPDKVKKAIETIRWAA